MGVSLGWGFGKDLGFRSAWGGEVGVLLGWGMGGIWVSPLHAGEFGVSSGVEGWGGFGIVPLHGDLWGFHWNWGLEGEFVVFIGMGMDLRILPAWGCLGFLLRWGLGGLGVLTCMGEFGGFVGFEGGFGVLIGMGDGIPPCMGGIWGIQGGRFGDDLGFPPVW